MENAAFEHLLLTSMANRASRKNTKRFKSGRFVTFVLGILIAIFMVNAEVHAMSLGAHVPNGVGFSVKIPLNGMAADTKSAEFHMFALHNRSKTMRVEAPLHGRFMRVKIAQMKYVMRFAKKSGKSSATSQRASSRVRRVAPPLSAYRRASFSMTDVVGSSISVAPPAHYSRQERSPQEPVTASGAVMSEQTPAPRNRRNVSAPAKRTKISKSAARQLAHDFARRYAIMRARYIKLRKRSPSRAHKAYRQLMKFYKVAQSWQKHQN